MTSSNAFKPLTKDDVAEVLGVSLRTIDNWVGENILPAPKKLGNRVYWHPNTFYAWLDLRLSSSEDVQELRVEPSLAPTETAPRPNLKVQPKGPKNELGALRYISKQKLEALNN